MQILNTSYTFKTANYAKPTPQWLKLLADILLLISAIIVFVPDFPLKEWLMFAGSAFKLISKFISDHTVEAQPEEIPSETGVS